jgi:hypothetical protein
VLLTSADPGAIALTDSQYLIAVSNTARPSVDDSGLVRSQTVPLPAVPTGSPLFCLNLLHYFDFQIPFSHQLLKPGIFIF